MNIMNSIGLWRKKSVVSAELLITAVVLGSLTLGVPDYKVQVKTPSARKSPESKEVTANLHDLHMEMAEVSIANIHVLA